MAFSDFAYYTKTYHGKLSDADYAAFVVKANAEITAQTFGRISADMTDRLKLCECEITDVMYAYAQTPTGITSVSNDGYSVNYGDTNSIMRGEPQEILMICKKYLTYPVNLMCRWM